MSEREENDEIRRSVAAELNDARISWARSAAEAFAALPTTLLSIALNGGGGDDSDGDDSDAPPRVPMEVESA